MEILNDWKMWLFILSLSQLGLMTYGFIVIKFNDLKHLTKDVSGLIKKVDKVSCKVNKIDKGLAVQKQRIDNLEKSTR